MFHVAKKIHVQVCTFNLNEPSLPRTYNLKQFVIGKHDNFSFLCKIYLKDIYCGCSTPCTFCRNFPWHRHLHGHGGPCVNVVAFFLETWMKRIMLKVTQLQSWSYCFLIASFNHFPSKTGHGCCDSDIYLPIKLYCILHFDFHPLMNFFMFNAFNLPFYIFCLFSLFCLEPLICLASKYVVIFPISCIVHVLYHHHIYSAESLSYDLKLLLL